MSKIIIKLILFFKVDILLTILRNQIHLAEINRVEQKSGNKINYVDQGFGGVKIISVNGDYSKFKIDNTSHLKSDTIIECSGGVSIGKYFHTGRGLTIFSINHNYKDAEAIPYDNKIIDKPVVIKDFVWCGANVTIVPGVIIGEGVIIASGCVVTKDVPDYAIIGGNPHNVLSYRDIDAFMKLKNEEKFY